jgi:3D (Asp-Asp-Asp) domain-containing protein
MQRVSAEIFYLIRNSVCIYLMTKINDLPNLPANNFDPAQDLIIIQKPNGATYKMLAATALSSIAQGEFQTETKTATVVGQNSAKIIFSYNNLLSLNSSVLVQVTGQSFNGQFSLTKSAGIANFTNYGIPSTTNNVDILTGKEGNRSIKLTVTIKIYDDIIEISNMRVLTYSNSGKLSGGGWRSTYSSFTISATLQANIKA